MNLTLHLPQPKERSDSVDRAGAFRAALLRAYVNSLCCTQEEKRLLVRMLIEKLQT